MIKVLLLEDDVLFSETLIDSFDGSDFAFTHVSDGEKFLNLAYEENFDIFLLDINVPLVDGISSLNQIRGVGNTTPAIFITSYKDKETLKNCFLSGCDDYLTKPFDSDELQLRIVSVLKRSGKAIDILKFDNLIYNPSNNTIYRDDELVIDGGKVAELFKLCYENRGKIVTKEMIASRLWSFDADYSEGSLRVYVTKLQKLFLNKKIHNVKNIGYKIEF